MASINNPRVDLPWLQSYQIFQNFIPSRSALQKRDQYSIENPSTNHCKRIHSDNLYQNNGESSIPANKRFKPNEQMSMGFDRFIKDYHNKREETMTTNRHLRVADVRVSLDDKSAVPSAIKTGVEVWI